MRSLLTALLATLTLPATAAAATAQVEKVPPSPFAGGDYLLYAAAPGEANQVSFTAAGGAVVIRDAGAPIDVGEGCVRLGPSEVSCLAPTGAAFDAAYADLGDGDDSARVEHTSFFVHLWVVAGGDGSDALDASAGFGWPTVRIALGGGAGDDRLSGSEGPDFLFGGPGADRLEGHGGDDSLDGDGATAGDDVLDGGEGSDVIDYGLRGGPVLVDLAAGRGGGDGEHDRLVSIEDAAGGAAPDILYGDDRPNTLAGYGSAGCGADVVPPGAPAPPPPPPPIPECVASSPRPSGGDALIGRGGDDRLPSSPLADRLAGGDGNDWFDHPDRRDRVECGHGRDDIDLEDADPGAAGLGSVGPPLPRGCDRIHLTSFTFTRPVVRGRVARTRVDAPPPYGNRCGAGLELRRRGALLGRTRWRSSSDVGRRVAIPLTAQGRRLARRHTIVAITQLRYIGGIPGNYRRGITCFEDGFPVDGVRIRL
jgi:RTX calcium-binding nonapeptide repeat (4 copies)